MTIWKILEIEVTTDLSIIKIAYAKKLRIHKPETDPEGFKLLRKAYETALKYINDNSIEVNINEPIHKQEKSNVNYEQIAINNFVSTLLDKLKYEGENEAVQFFENSKSSDILINLETKEKVEHLIADYLLTIPVFYNFALYLFNYFDWNKKLEKMNDSAFHALIYNLFLRIRSFFYYLGLKDLAKINSRSEAKEKKVNWYQCYAAKILLSKGKDVSFFSIMFADKKQKQAVQNMIKEIGDKYPEVVGLGLNVYNFGKWESYLKKRATTSKMRSIYWLGIFLIFIGKDCYDQSKIYHEYTFYTPYIPRFETIINSFKYFKF